MNEPRVFFSTVYVLMRDEQPVEEFYGPLLIFGSLEKAKEYHLINMIGTDTSLGSDDIFGPTKIQEFHIELTPPQGNSRDLEEEEYDDE